MDASIAAASILKLSQRLANFLMHPVLAIRKTYLSQDLRSQKVFRKCFPIAIFQLPFTKNSSRKPGKPDEDFSPVAEATLVQDLRRFSEFHDMGGTVGP